MEGRRRRSVDGRWHRQRAETEIMSEKTLVDVLRSFLTLQSARDVGSEIERMQRQTAIASVGRSRKNKQTQTTITNCSQLTRQNCHWQCMEGEGTKQPRLDIVCHFTFANQWMASVSSSPGYASSYLLVAPLST